MTLSPASRPTSPDDPRLDGWYHTIDFGGGILSHGHFDHRTVVDCYGIPDSLAGLSALDVGSGDGFFSLELERRGAERVLAVDVDSLGDCDWLPEARDRLPQSQLESTGWRQHFEFAKEWLGSAIEKQTLSVYDLSPEQVGTFDVAFCADVLLHLKNPLQALMNIRSVTRGVAVIETVIEPELERWAEGRPLMSFGVLDLEDEIGDNNTYWRFTSGALRDMLRYAGFARVELQEPFGLPPFGLPAVSARGYVD